MHHFNELKSFNCIHEWSSTFTTFVLVGWITPVQMTASASLFITSVINTFHPDITWSPDDIFTAHQHQRVETASHINIIIAVVELCRKLISEAEFFAYT